LTESSRDHVRDALLLAKGRVKIAALLLNGCDLDTAAQLLSTTGDHLGKALTLASKARTGKN
jgi:N-acetylmuramic acid 6-phosphate (MurNAc-6-P) etherase